MSERYISFISQHVVGVYCYSQSLSKLKDARGLLNKFAHYKLGHADNSMFSYIQDELSSYIVFLRRLVLHQAGVMFALLCVFIYGSLPSLGC